MTPMQSTHRRALIYSGIADAMERDPIQGGDTSTRATVPMGRGFSLWQRMNADAQLVWIDDAEGRPRALTPKQAKVLELALETIDGQGMTMRDMAKELRFAPSTVSRALTKLQAWGVIAYIVGRGRYAGLVIFRRVQNDGLDRFRKAAQERVRRWMKTAQDRILSVKFNVASRYTEGEIGGRGYLSDYYLVESATLTRPWTADELAGIE